MSLNLKISFFTSSLPSLFFIPSLYPLLCTYNWKVILLKNFLPKEKITLRKICKNAGEYGSLKTRILVDFMQCIPCLVYFMQCKYHVNLNQFFTIPLHKAHFLILHILMYHFYFQSHLDQKDVKWSLIHLFQSHINHHHYYYLLENALLIYHLYIDIPSKRYSWIYRCSGSLKYIWNSIVSTFRMGIIRNNT